MVATCGRWIQLLVGLFGHGMAACCPVLLGKRVETCVVPCADLSTALTQYTLGPLLPWWHNLPCQISFCAVSEQKHAGSMVMLLVQVWAVSWGALAPSFKSMQSRGLCSAPQVNKIHMESPPLANDHAWVESSVTYHQKHLSSIQNHHWWLTFLSKKRFTSGRHDPAFGFSASTSSTLLYFSVIWIRIINTEIQMTIQGSSSWAITIQKAVLP